MVMISEAPCNGMRQQMSRLTEQLVTGGLGAGDFLCMVLKNPSLDQVEPLLVFSSES